MKDVIAVHLSDAENRLEWALIELARADDQEASTWELELRVAEFKGEVNAFRRLHGMLV